MRIPRMGRLRHNETGPRCRPPRRDRRPRPSLRTCNPSPLPAGLPPMAGHARPQDTLVPRGSTRRDSHGLHDEDTCLLRAPQPHSAWDPLAPGPLRPTPTRGTLSDPRHPPAVPGGRTSHPLSGLLVASSQSDTTKSPPVSGPRPPIYVLCARRVRTLSPGHMGTMLLR